ARRGRAAAAHVRHLRRRGARRRTALRRRDRRVRRAARLTLVDRLLELARTDERAVLFTVLGGPQRGAKLLVLLERGETVGDGPAALADLADLAADVRHNHVFEHAGVDVFAEVFGPPPRLVVVGAVDAAEELCRAAGAIGWRTVCV